MDLSEYAHQAHRDSKQWFPDRASDLRHHILGLAGESGEVANLVKKLDRGDVNLDDIRKELAKELVDVLIYTFNAFAIIGVNPDKVWDIKRAENINRFGNGKEVGE